MKHISIDGDLLMLMAGVCMCVCGTHAENQMGKIGQQYSFMHIILLV